MWGPMVQWNSCLESRLVCRVRAGLIGELPNVYIYSVNNPSEGTIAKRRSDAELISYLTPPIENAGLYKGLATMKDLVGNYRRSTDEEGRQRLFAAIEQQSRELNFDISGAGASHAS